VILKMIVEKQMDCRLAGETEVLGENLPQCHLWRGLKLRLIYKFVVDESN
jgi:hypothetical protein